MKVSPKWNGAIGAGNILACAYCAAVAQYDWAFFCAMAAAINLAIWRAAV